MIYHFLLLNTQHTYTYIYIPSLKTNIQPGKWRLWKGRRLGCAIHDQNWSVAGARVCYWVNPQFVHRGLEMKYTLFSWVMCKIGTQKPTPVNIFMFSQLLFFPNVQSMASLLLSFFPMKKNANKKDHGALFLILILPGEMGA